MSLSECRSAILFLAVGLPLGLLAPLCRAQRVRRAAIRASGLTVVHATVGGRGIEFRIRMVTAPVPSDGVQPTLANWAAVWQCSGASSPCSVALDAHISVSGHSIELPGDVVVDLGDSHWVSIGPWGGGFVVRVEGGDASASFVLRIFVRGGEVRKTTMSSGIVPDYPLSTTVYRDGPALN